MKMQRSDTYSQIINTADIMFARNVKEDMAQEYMRKVRDKAGKAKGNDITVDNYADYAGLSHKEGMDAFEKKELSERHDYRDK
jgi:hypothetical protein